MYQTRHSGPPNNPQAPPPPSAQAQFSGPLGVINESCDRIKREFDALQAANHSLRVEIEKLEKEKQEIHKQYIMYYEMSYGLHIDVCKQKEIAKRLNNIILNILPIVSSDQQAQIASSVDRAKQVSTDELNSIVDQQLREGYAAAELGHPSMAAAAAAAAAGMPNLGARPLPGGPGAGAMPTGLPGGPGAAGLPGGLPGSLPGALHGLPPGMPHGLPLHLAPNMPPHSMPPHGPPLHGLPPQALMQPNLNRSSPILVVDGNDDRISSPHSHHNGSNSPKENGGSLDWNQKGVKKERPLSRASSVTSGCGPSGRERASPKTSGSHKAKASPNTLAMSTDPMNPLGPGPMPNSTMPGLAGHSRPMFPMGPIGPDGMPSVPMGPGGVKMPLGPIPEPSSIQVDHEGRTRCIPCSPRALADPEIPKRAREIFTLDHGEVVCAVALSQPGFKNIYYTGGKGLVKVWCPDNSESNNEIGSPRVLKNPTAEIPCLPPEAYVRSCKLLPDGSKLIVAGEKPPISMWDLANGGAVKIGDLRELAPACYALAISPDSKICITCCSDGTIGLYDVHNLQLISKFQGHEDGASCIDISSDGNTLWTGGLDTTLKSWSLNSGRIGGDRDCLSKTSFNSQIFSLGCCPTDDYIAVGMENNFVEVVNSVNRNEKMQLKLHDSCVLALKFASSGKWFISTGKDKLLNLCGSPSINCPQIMKVSNITNSP